MQIVAKTTLTVLGIYAVVSMYRFYPGRYRYSIQESSIFHEILFLSAYTVIVAFIAYFMILKNDSLSRKLAGPGQQLDGPTQAVWVTKSLYTGLVLAGLILLPNSIHGIIKFLKIPFVIRPIINEIIDFKKFPEVFTLSYRQWYKNIYELLTAILGVYLVLGAPHFIRWQIKQSLAATNPEGVEK